MFDNKSIAYDLFIFSYISNTSNKIIKLKCNFITLYYNKNEIYSFFFLQ